MSKEGSKTLHQPDEVGQSMPILAIKDVHKSFGGLKALDGATLSVEKGKIVGLIGPNGSGKTTLFNVIAGALKPDSGEVWFKGERIDGLKPYEVYERGLVRTFQVPRLFFKLPVIDNILLAGRNQIGDTFTKVFLKRSAWIEQEKSLIEKALSIAELLGLSEVLTQPASNLSGGQMKLLELARALMSDPITLLVDEPAAGVSLLLVENMFKKIYELRREQNLTIFIIEHRMEVILNYVDWVYAMHKGRVIASGPPAEIIQNKQVIDVYLGEAT
ncbi:MAG: ABC transporter ATP-binding protein [Nitrososphaerales archaeon]